jgi:hypothetical protein
MLDFFCELVGIRVERLAILGFASLLSNKFLKTVIFNCFPRKIPNLHWPV